MRWCVIFIIASFFAHSEQVKLPKNFILPSMSVFKSRIEPVNFDKNKKASLSLPVQSIAGISVDNCVLDAIAESSSTTRFNITVSRMICKNDKSNQAIDLSGIIASYSDDLPGVEASCSGDKCQIGRHYLKLYTDSMLNLTGLILNKNN